MIGMTNLYRVCNWL